jgi:hypothetical protein
MSEGAGSSRHGAGFWAAVAAGGLVMAVATWGAFDSLSTSSFGSWGKWIIGLDLLNDFLILPIVALVGVGVGRLPLGSARAPVQAGLFATAIVLLVAWPGLAGLSASDNPTIQPLDYTTATLTVLAVVWAGVGAWALVRRHRAPPALPAGGRSERT